MDFPNSLSPFVAIIDVSVQSCCRSVLVGHSTLACSCVGVHRRTSLMNSSLLLQQCLTCLVCLIWMVLEMGGRWTYSCCFVGCCFQDLFNMTHSILEQFLFSFSSICLVSINVVHPYRRNDLTAAWKKLCFILSNKFDFHMIDNFLKAVHAFTSIVCSSY